MRSAKVPVAAAAADNETIDTLKAPRLRKASKTSSQLLTSVSSSANSSDAEGPGTPSRGANPETLLPRHAVVIDHQGAGKVVHKPDGTVVWEPAPECADGSGSRRGGGAGGGSSGPLKDVLSTGGVLMAVGSAVAGLMAAQHHVSSPASHNITTLELAGEVANTVTAYLAGTAAGMVVGPLLAARLVAGAVMRPALVAVAVHQGFKVLGRWRCGVAGLLRKLQSSDTSRVLEALRAIIALARRSPRFAREFNKLKGMEVLLQRLAAAMPDCPLLHLIAQALAELCKDEDCKDSLVAAGGVPRLVALLQHPNPVVSGYGLSALAEMSDHALAIEAIREAGGVSRLVELAAASLTAPYGPIGPMGQSSLVLGAAGTIGVTGAAASGSCGPAASGAALPMSGGVGGFDRRAALLPAVKLLQALSLDPAGKAAIGAAGGVPMLLDVVARSEPRSEAAATAVAALHGCLRGCPDNQRTLAALPAASEVLRGALAGFGPCWHSAKGDLHSLLNVLARLQGVQEAGGFIVVQSQVATAAAREAGAVGGAAGGAGAQRA